MPESGKTELTEGYVTAHIGGLDFLSHFRPRSPSSNPAVIRINPAVSGVPSLLLQELHLLVSDICRW